MVEISDITKKTQHLVRLDEASCAADGGDKIALSEAIDHLRYEVSIDPDLENLKFNGQCKLSFTAKKTFKHIFIHMKLLDIS